MNTMIVTDSNELIPIPPEIAWCYECEKPLKVQLIDGWNEAGISEAGIEDQFIYDTQDPEIMFFLYCGCQDWKIDDRRPVLLEEGAEWRPDSIRCDCDLTDEYDRVAEWLKTKHITLSGHLNIISDEEWEHIRRTGRFPR